MKYLRIFVLLFAILFVKRSDAQKPITPPADFYSLSFKDIKGELFKFKELEGKKVLIVNTASKCGYTPQFAGLEELHQNYGPNLVVLGFPSNDFGSQDPGSNSEILSFCEENYGVTFRMMEKSSVKGSERNEVFRWLSDKTKNGWNDVQPSWNFGKYLIDEEGRLVAFFPSKVKPTDAKIVDKLK